MDSPRERFILKRYLFYKHGVDNITSMKKDLSFFQFIRI